jgi:hypothetical protein
MNNAFTPHSNTDNPKAYAPKRKDPSQKQRLAHLIAPMNAEAMSSC